MDKFQEQTRKFQEQIQEFQAEMEKIKEKADKNCFDFVTQSCGAVEQKAKMLMHDTQTNPDVSYGKKRHHPSLPYNAPAVDTGLLRLSVTHSVEVEKNNVVGYVGSLIKDDPYPVYLEYGTSKMQPRPWLGAALESCRSYITNLWRELFKK